MEYTIEFKILYEDGMKISHMKRDKYVDKKEVDDFIHGKQMICNFNTDFLYHAIYIFFSKYNDTIIVFNICNTK